MSNYKKKNIKVLIGSLAVLAIELLIFCGIDINDEWTCKNDFIYSLIGDAEQLIILSAFIILFLSLILLFFKEAIFTAWWKFTKWYLIAAVILVVLSPVQSGGLLPIDVEIVSWWLAGIYLFVSLILIAVKSYKLRKN